MTKGLGDSPQEDARTKVLGRVGPDAETERGWGDKDDTEEGAVWKLEIRVMRSRTRNLSYCR